MRWRPRQRRAAAAWLIVGLLLVAAPSAIVLAASTDSSSTGTLELNTEDDLVTPGSVSGRVWDDLDHDGFDDGGEPGVNGVTVTLLDDGGSAVDTITTANDGSEDGRYRFDDLPPGMYQLEFSSLPAGYLFTYVGADSVADPGTGRSATFSLTSGQELTAQDAGIWLPAPALEIEKRAQGDEADTPPGPSVPIGDTVSFDYLVTNTGNEPLWQLSVTDDQSLTVTCPSFFLAVGETLACSASDMAVAGSHANTGTAEATGQFSGQAVSADDLAHYIGVARLLDVEKAVNGQDADTAAEAVTLPVGDPVEFTFVVTNTGTEDVTGIGVDDDVYGPIACPQDALGVGLSMTCTAVSDTADAGLHTDIATVTGTGATTSEPAGDTDPASYWGRAPAMSLLKEVRDPSTGTYVDGDADAGSPGSNDGLIPVYEQGATADYRFRVTNTGDTPIANVDLTDDHCNGAPALGGGDAAPPGVLDVGETWFLSCTVVQLAAGFTNIATVTGDSVPGPPAGSGATERATIEVAGTPGVTIEKQVKRPSGVWADSATIDRGATVRFRIQVTNTGEVALHDLVVTDGRAPACARTIAGPLDPGQSTGFWTCSLTDVSAAFTNTARVTATPVTGSGAVHDSDGASVHVRTRLAQDLVLDKTTAAQGPGTATFRLTVTNQGPGTAPAPIVVHDNLPAGLTYRSAAGVGWTCEAHGQQVTCTRGQSLAEGVSSSVMLTVAVAPGTGTVTNNAGVQGVDTDPTNNFDDADLRPSTTPPPGGGGGGGGGGAAAGGAPRGDLPHTGVDVRGLLLLAMALVGAGVVLVAVGVRRRQLAASLA